MYACAHVCTEHKSMQLQLVKNWQHNENIDNKKCRKYHKYLYLLLGTYEYE